ncbi:hypothetical protein C7974DRAFT_407395 [Boeremia exigua]|uniref:uncharacterized protein n=1 Tax=Boeremia exigua TaxID=749465 RepID=UPI001E8D5630|nr:uncharacterized protein C7974DRAFT_407395 [Boeremia exigua]KAH6643673.1 hypothetical protein C7974DRAFT_407395 [Boeremia exigua]
MERRNTLPSGIGGKYTSNVDDASGLRAFCSGHPPKQSFLESDSAFYKARRSTLADNPELDVQLKASMVQYKAESFLPLNFKSVRLITQYLNGSKPLAYIHVFSRLLITSETNDVRAGLFIAALERIGLHCKHLAVLAPFHTVEFKDMSYNEAGRHGDWRKILECLPNIRKITFEDQIEQPTPLRQSTFHSLVYALPNTSLEECFVLDFDISPSLLFGLHYDFHRRYLPTAAPLSLGKVFKPLTMIAGGIIYADGTEPFGLSDDNAIYGSADDDDPFFGSVNDVDTMGG